MQSRTKGLPARSLIRRQSMNIRNPYEYNPYALDGEARPAV